jgi:hypothetical protein
VSVFHRNKQRQSLCTNIPPTFQLLTRFGPIGIPLLPLGTAG